MEGKYKATVETKYTTRKRNWLIISVLSSLLFLSSCAQNEDSVTAETTPPIYVDRDDLQYAESNRTNEQLPSDESSNPSDEAVDEPDNPSTGNHGNGEVTTRPSVTTSRNSGNPNEPEPTQDPLPDDIYNVRIEPNLSDTNISLGEIKITCYNTIDDNGMTGFSTVFTLGEQAYGSYRDNLFPHNGAQYISQPYTLDIEQGGIAFKFDGAGHYIKNTGDENGAQMWFELERDDSIIPNEKVGSIQPADGYNVSLKGIAVKLGDFTDIYSNGYAKYKPAVQLKFLTEKIDIEVGMPFYLVTETFGEGTVIAADNGEEQRSEYHIYKNKEYTLILEKTEYPDIQTPVSQEADITAPEDTILVRSMFLILNEPAMLQNTEES